MISYMSYIYLTDPAAHTMNEDLAKRFVENELVYTLVVTVLGIWAFVVGWILGLVWLV